MLQSVANTFFFTVAALLSWIGVIHAYQITDHGVENYFVGYGGNWMAAPGFVLAYSAVGMFMIVLHLLQAYAGIWKQGSLFMMEGYWQWRYQKPQEAEPEAIIDEESARQPAPTSTTNSERDKLLAVNL